MLFRHCIFGCFYAATHSASTKRFSKWLSLGLICCILGCRFPNNQAPTAHTAIPTTANEKQRHKDGSYDDLQWMLGRWWCVEKAWLNPTNTLHGSHDERLLEWFNVYLPYSDKNLTVALTDDPEDRQIAAEFIVRSDPNDYYAKAGLSPMSPRSVVRLSTTKIRIGDMFNRIDLSYKLITNSRAIRMEIESKHMRLLFEKQCDETGDIRKSWVVAPLVKYSDQELALLAQNYIKLVRTNENDLR